MTDGDDLQIYIQADNRLHQALINYPRASHRILVEGRVFFLSVSLKHKAVASRVDRPK